MLNVRTTPGPGLFALLATVCVLTLGGCSEAETAPAAGSASAERLTIETAWAAELELATAIDPEAATSVAYATITNSGEEQDSLIEVTSDAVRRIEMHETVTSGSSGKMIHAEEIDLPAGSTVELKPGGLHLMLIGPHDDLVAGTPIDMRFAFESGSVLEVTVPVINRADRP